MLLLGAELNMDLMVTENFNFLKQLYSEKNSK